MLISHKNIDKDTTKIVVTQYINELIFWGFCSYEPTKLLDDIGVWRIKYKKQYQKTIN